jgi:hypothetical protein
MRYGRGYGGKALPQIVIARQRIPYVGIYQVAKGEE